MYIYLFSNSKSIANNTQIKREINIGHYQSMIINQCECDL